MEIIVSVLLIALVLAGMANIFVAGKRYILHSRSRIAGGDLGRYFLNPLQMDVVASEKSTGALDGWDQANNRLQIPLGSASSTWTGATHTVNNIIYTPVYTITRVNDGAGVDTGLRRVVVNISWTEPSP